MFSNDRAFANHPEIIREDRGSYAERILSRITWTHPTTKSNWSKYEAKTTTKRKARCYPCKLRELKKKKKQQRTFDFCPNWTPFKSNTNNKELFLILHQIISLFRMVSTLLWANSMQWGYHQGLHHDCVSTTHCDVLALTLHFQGKLSVALSVVLCVFLRFSPLIVCWWNGNQCNEDPSELSDRTISILSSQAHYAHN